MVVAEFSDSFPPLIDGVATVAYNYHNLINKLHGTSYAVAPRFPHHTDKRSDVLRFISFPIFFEKYRFGVPGLDSNFKNKLNALPLDIIHTHTPFAGGKYAYIVAQSRGIPLVATMHSKYPKDFKSVFKLDLIVKIGIQKIVRFYKKADAVWVPNQGVIDVIREYGFRGEVDVVPNGSDITLRSEDEKKKLRTQGLQTLQCERDVPLLLYVGQHRWVKNLRMMLSALRILKDSGHNFQMRCVGRGGDLPSIRRLVHTLKLGRCVQFMGPVYQRDLIRSFYAAADLFLFPSLYDTDGVASREAAGFFVPTLFVRGGTMTGEVVDCKNGYLSENDEQSYAAKIALILKDHQGLTISGRGAHDSFHVSWEQVAGLAYGKYQEIIARYAHRRSKTVD